MAEDRKQIPCMNTKWLDGKRNYNYRQWLARFKQYMKTKYDIDIGPLIKEKTTTETEWDRKEEEIEQNFVWVLGPETTHQKTRSEYRTESDKIKIDKLIKLYYRYYLLKRNKYNSR